MTKPKIEKFEAPKSFLSEQEAWALLAKKHSINADMVVKTQHTSESWCWEIDRERAHVGILAKNEADAQPAAVSEE